MEKIITVMIIIGVISGILVIDQKSGAFVSLLYLVLSLISGSIMIIILGMNYIGLTLIIIYAVGISILIIFIIMMLDLNKYSEKKSNHSVTIMMIMIIINYMGMNQKIVRRTIINYDEMINNNKMINTIANIIYTEYMSYLIIIAIVLLMVMIAVIKINTGLIA